MGLHSEIAGEAPKIGTQVSTGQMERRGRKRPHLEAVIPDTKGGTEGEVALEPHSEAVIVGASPKPQVEVAGLETAEVHTVEREGRVTEAALRPQEVGTGADSNRMVGGREGTVPSNRLGSEFHFNVIKLQTIVNSKGWGGIDTVIVNREEVETATEGADKDRGGGRCHTEAAVREAGLRPY